MPAIDNEVRNHILAFLQGDEDLDTFEHWFVGSTWDDRTALVIAVDHLFAEESELASRRDGLLTLVSTVVVGEPLFPVSTGTSVTETRTVERDLAIAGT